MNYLFPFILLSSLVIVSYSAIYQERLHTLHGHENFCYDIEENILYKNGDIMKWKSKECGRKICVGSNRGKAAYAEIHTCGVYLGPPECKVKVDLRLPYPNCCGRLICTDSRFRRKRHLTI